MRITLPRQLGIAVRQAREDAGMTQAQLAERAGVSVRLVVALELGDAAGIRADKLLPILTAAGLQD